MLLLNKNKIKLIHYKSINKIYAYKWDDEHNFGSNLANFTENCYK